MSRRNRNAVRVTLLCVILVAGGALPGVAQDEDLFSAQVPPNVMLMVDNSGSMNAVMEHPAFDSQTFNYTCDFMASSGNFTTTLWDESVPSRPTRYVCRSAGCRLEIRSTDSGWVSTADPNDDPQNGYVERRFCGETRRLYTDGLNEDYGNRIWYFSEYAEWLYSIDDADNTTLIGPGAEARTAPQILADIANPTNGQNYITGDRFARFQIARITAARDIARDVIYQTNSDCPAFQGDCGVYEDRVRFGLAQFQSSSHGGFVGSGIDEYSANRTDIETAISSLDAQTGTPLGETLFKIYTYFMSRDSADRPLGQDGATRFPEYRYRESNGSFTNTLSLVPDDPISESCQKNFVIMITDGEPTNDTFTSSGSNTQGFNNFNSLIGDYAPDSPGDLDIGTDGTPEVGSPPWGNSSGAGYLDDIAAFMQQNDCRPDHAGENVIDVYTVGFGTLGPVNALLQKTADQGNGLFFSGNQAETLTEALVSSVQDIISKSQGFSAATVPAARTSAGGELYTTLFQPTSARPFWPGLMRSYRITVAGEIFDRDGNCALGDLTDPNFCAGGTFLNEDLAPPFWNASKVMPGANNRNLKVSIAAGSSQIVQDFDHNVSAADLGASVGQISNYPPSPNVTSNADLDEAIVAFIAGCEWGTGVVAGGSDDFQGCVDRTRVDNGVTQADRLGDIFHSNPVVVGPPRSFIEEVSYGEFAANPQYAERERIIIAGANDGFLHGFNAGSWDGVLNRYDEGTGVEVFGFMPWGARGKVADLAKDDATLHSLSVDGSPSVADVWLDRNSNPLDDKIESEWRTVAVAGLREGGEHYYALDLTDPAAANYPSYLWEFPRESDTFWRDYIGETWSQPVITRVRMERTSGDIEEMWVAIFGFGYDATSDPNEEAVYNPLSLKGRGLMMVEIATGRPVAVRKFGTAPGDVSDMLYAIPSSPAVLDYDQDGFADVIYVGDVGGNVWKWVIRAPGIADPGATTLYQPTWSFRKFFDHDPSRPNTAHARSFYFAPSATVTQGILHLGFGSGERSDLNCSSTLNGCNLLNRFYILRDRDIWDTGTLSVIDGRSSAGAGDLTDVTAFENACPAVDQSGLFFSVSDGEKFVTNSEVFNSFFFSSTFSPDLSNACEPEGQSTLYGFLARCGQGFFGATSSISPIAGSERSLDIGKGLPTDARLSIAPGGGGNRLIISKQNGELINIDSGEAGYENGQLFWRELD